MNKIVIFSLLSFMSISLSTNSFAANRAPQDQASCWRSFKMCMGRTTKTLARVGVAILPIIIDILTGEAKFDSSSIEAITDSLTTLGEKNPRVLLELEKVMEDTTGISKDNQLAAWELLKTSGLIADDGKVTSKEAGQFLQTLLASQAVARTMPETSRASHQSFKQIITEVKAIRTNSTEV